MDTAGTVFKTVINTERFCELVCSQRSKQCVQQSTEQRVATAFWLCGTVQAATKKGPQFAAGAKCALQQWTARGICCSVVAYFLFLSMISGLLRTGASGKQSENSCAVRGAHTASCFEQRPGCVRLVTTGARSAASRQHAGMSRAERFCPNGPLLQPDLGGAAVEGGAHDQHGGLRHISRVDHLQHTTPVAHQNAQAAPPSFLTDIALQSILAVSDDDIERALFGAH